jgi:beta-ribofuranosylaminobenzene 5'-phosphate synthase
MIRVETGSRLHFGLLRPPPVGGRRGFGGCGLMVEAPAVRVAVEPAADWSASGPVADRALAVARRVAPARPHRVVVEACPPEHVGLGVGTQLSLAVARAVVEQGVPGDELARVAGRGGRSGIGVHGFDRGGFLVDGGKRSDDDLAPLIARAEFPPDWRMVLLTPPDRPDWHGERERTAVAALSAAPADDALCRLVLLGMLPALAARDLPAFSEAIAEYNARAGEPFRAAQSGLFAPAAEPVIDWLRGQGIRGIGQSSWGPTVFAVTDGLDQAEAVLRSARERWGSGVTAVATAARNRGVMSTQP